MLEKEIQAFTSARTELDAAEATVRDRHSQRAVKAVRAFAEAGKGMDPREPLADIVSDLVADLQYLAMEAKLDWSAILSGATENFQTEVGS